ncbi:MAG: phospho-sugar mutase [Candidatus Sumerlaeia bacterium]
MDLQTIPADIRGRIEAALSPRFDESWRREIQDLVAAGNVEELKDRFYTDLEFGTGGMRGLIAAGLNRMNRWTVGRATQGLANYVRSTLPAGVEPRAVICRDSRRMSREFAETAACVLAANGFTVYFFDDLRPTPELSFAIRYYSAHTGVMITASHNPPEYNGYKAYWSDGGQVVPPHDAGIIREVKAVEFPEGIRSGDFARFLSDGRIVIAGGEVDEAYLQAVLRQLRQPELCRQSGGELKILYTPLHGAGIKGVPPAMKRAGFTNFHVLESQAQPDGEFPTVRYPNPEDPEALTLLLEEGRRIQADIVLASDPDSDRMAVGVRDPKSGEITVLSGNQTGCLMLDYLARQDRDKGRLPANAAIVTTIVSTPLALDIARDLGVTPVEVLTGFKYMAEKIRQWHDEADGQPYSYLFGFEESIGYLPGIEVRDKDGVMASVLIAEIALTEKLSGRTLVDRLNDIYLRYGLYADLTHSITIKGLSGMQQIAAIMDELEKTPLSSINGSPVARIVNVRTGQILDGRTGRQIATVDLPRSRVLVFEAENGTKVIARPSGTEPKIKFYFFVCDRTAKGAPVESLPNRQEALRRKLNAVVEDFLGRIKNLKRDR